MSQTLKTIKSRPKLYIGLLIIFVLIGVVLVGASSQNDYLGLKDAIAQAVGNTNGTLKALTILQVTLGGALAPTMTDVQLLLLYILIFIAALSFIWATRQTVANKKVTIRQVLYNAPTPLISVLVIILLFCFQILPAAIGLYIFSVASSGGFMSIVGVSALVTLLLVLLLTLSLYLIVNTIIAVVIVTLPGMPPLAALNSAKQLVLGRRLSVLLRIIGLAVWLSLFWVVLLLPFLLLDSFTNIEAVPFVPVILPLLVGCSVMFSSVYLYRLYRSLL